MFLVNSSLYFVYYSSILAVWQKKMHCFVVILVDKYGYYEKSVSYQSGLLMKMPSYIMSIRLKNNTKTTPTHGKMSQVSSTGHTELRF